MRKEEIFRLLGVSDETELKSLLNCKSVEYADVITEENYFIINRETSNYGIPSIERNGFDNKKHKLLKLSTDLNKQPYICEAFLTGESLDTLGSKKRKKLKDPINWECVTSDKFAKKYFHRGHIIGHSLANELVKKIYNKNKRILFVQTAWSNMNAQGLNTFSQAYFESILEKTIEKGKNIFYKSKLIYKNKNDKIPIGIQIQAISIDEELSINVFIPNVSPGISIDYTEGKITRLE
ncbi:hypothetical protein [Streptococcus salivarius]|uniref:hypothetical protein n=1 Tax=Streptococcus salivarius TaxID=1304 RepID=UPI001C02D8C0|nr:hypothetical protein [Streptococcus salivarius]MBT9629140.1 hypothetical protein [Streptococcus salivarius]